MPNEKRRSPRFPVSGLTGTLHVSISARLQSRSGEPLVLEVTRPLRTGKRHVLRGARPDERDGQLEGTVTSCRLTAVRQGAQGSSISVYTAVFHPDAHPGTPALNLQDPLLVHEARDAVIRVLSLTGALVETELELLVGSSCRLDLPLPDGHFSSRACVVFLHQIREGDPPLFHLGVEFHNTPAEDGTSLEHYLANLAS